jgi:Mn2+/Fe2+ NRAMP family transporter
MHTQIGSKIVTLAVALIMNSAIMVGVALLFDAQSHQQLGVIASAKAASQSTHEATATPGA